MRFAKHVGLFSVLSIAALPLSCSSEDDPAPPSAMAGASGSSTTPPTGGTSSGSGTGGAAPASTGGQVAQTGGAGPATGGTSPSGVGGTSGGTSGGTPAGGANGGAPMGGAPAPTGGSAPVAGGGAGGVVTAGGGGAGGATAPANPLSHLADSAKTVGALLANRFSKQTLAFSSVANLPGDGYKTACEWYGSLGVAKHTSNQELLTALVNKFTPLKSNFVMAMTGGEAHVDRYIFGMVPLEIFLQTGDMSFLSLGTNVADTQQTTNQVRNAIDDMFMMTILQVQAYRATKNDKYLTFMSKTMVDYLKAQQANGLFFHNVNEAKVHWGRGNGWFAAGMAEIMRDLPKTAGDYATIEAGYEKMMDGLVKVQGPNGLWYQVLDMKDNASNWEETSGSAMFTYAMIAGVRSGVLDSATFVPVIDKAWAGIQKKINASGDVSDICVGTWYKASAAEYMSLSRLTGDGHGQAPVLWAAAELLR
jgi:unsaturated rhamnogalacturonyl hydrolase